VAHPPADRARLLARINAALGGILAPEWFTLSQSYPAGRVQGVAYEARQVHGSYVDLLPEAPKDGESLLTSEPSPAAVPELAVEVQPQPLDGKDRSNQAPSALRRPSARQRDESPRNNDKSKVHLSYIALYPSDFLADVAHLGNTELGIYWRPLLTYYQHRKPLPRDEDRLFRIAMAFSPEEQSACRNVICQYFYIAEHTTSGGDVLACYRQKRADKEMKAAEDRWLESHERTRAARKAKRRKQQEARKRASALASTVTTVVTESVTGSVTDKPKKQNVEVHEDRSVTESVTYSEPEPELNLKPSSASDDAGFSLFWKPYPRKVGRQDALKAWRKLKPDEHLLQEMLTSLETQKQSDAWTNGGGEFIPHPAKWLNGRRWEDELGLPEPNPSKPELSL
jgi:uncharacterized protein YdaU (DUF1376 family)